MRFILISILCMYLWETYKWFRILSFILIALFITKMIAPIFCIKGEQKQINDNIKKSPKNYVTDEQSCNLKTITEEKVEENHKKETEQREREKKQMEAKQQKYKNEIETCMRMYRIVQQSGDFEIAKCWRARLDDLRNHPENYF